MSGPATAMLDVISRLDLDEEQRKAATVVRNCSHNLLNLINDILDLSKIEADMMELERLDFALDDIMESGTERNIRQEDLERAALGIEPTSIEWMTTASNLVRFGGATGSYRELEQYLKRRN